MKTTSNSDKSNLKQKIKESALDEQSLSRAVDEGMKTESIDSMEFLKKLKSRIQ